MKSACLSCHGNFNYATDAKWVSSGLVVAGNPGGSKLFTYLKGNGISGSKANMPPSGSLASDQVNAVKTWIQGIGQP